MLLQVQTSPALWLGVLRCARCPWSGSFERSGRRVLAFMTRFFFNASLFGLQQRCFLMTSDVRCALVHIFSSICGALLVFTCHVALEFLTLLHA